MYDSNRERGRIGGGGQGGHYLSYGAGAWMWMGGIEGFIYV